MSTFRRRQMIAAAQGGGGSLPYDAEIEYLESDGNQYIDTNIVIGSTDRINVTAQFIQKSSGRNTLLGSFETGKNGVGIYHKTSTSTSIYANFGRNETSKSISLNNILSLCEYNLYKANFKITCGSKSWNTAISNPTNMSTDTLYLFAEHSTDMNNFVGKIYSVEILSSGTQVRDYIPVRVGQVGYMYDRVSGELFGNDGTGSFILGPDK